MHRNLSAATVFFAVIAVTVCGSLSLAGPSKALPTTTNFSRDVRPILSKHCFACHGPDENHRKANLRFDMREIAVNPRGARPAAIVPGKPSESLLIMRVTAESPLARMPPSATGDQLNAAEVSIITRWIKEGAHYDQHWAFVPPRRLPLPKVNNLSWPRNEIDYFILARLEKQGLKPSPEADRVTLFRRVSLDLRGLPPSPKEIETFLSDTQPGAYERAVERLLDDSAYGERWARMWLDLARYADSAGYGSDPLRTIWRYRDWVIDAFNRNLPFDQFTIEQLAGDLLPNPTIDQKMATAFHRNTMTNTEGGTDDEEFRVAAVRDRVDTTFQVWMGVTMGCAKCHSHKFDPISQKEYYELFAIFNQTTDNDQPDEKPTIPIAWPSIDEKIKEIDQKLAPLKAKLDATTAELEGAQTQWESTIRSASPTEREKVPAPILAIVDIPADQRSDEQQQTLAKHYRSIDPLLQPVRDEIAKLEAARPEPQTLPIMEELPADKRRTTHLMIKSNFLVLGDKVEAGIPSAFNPISKNTPIDRMALAKWLVNPANPLTARVAVNRYWAQIFGAGLVRTEEDFGTQGEWPSHLELLDWLATEYLRIGWDTKALLRLIVTSATYRQSSKVTPDRLAKDPENRLLSRAPRFRLEAELVRDQALSLSGLLSHKIGGPSVYPPQPPGLWQAAFNGQRTWATSTGEDRYRRGLYTFWRRTVPYPSMATFDAPSREFCLVRRIRTNTPLQALVTLNDPVYIEAAQALARRIVREGGGTVEDRASFALQLCLCRPASPEQIKRTAELFRNEQAHYRQGKEDAVSMATDPLGPLPDGWDAAELAAWTVTANVLLNLDSVLTKG